MRTQTHITLSYSTMMSEDTKCPGCQGDYTFINQFGNTRAVFWFSSLTDRFMKELPEERGKIIKKVKAAVFVPIGGTRLSSDACSTRLCAQNRTEVLCLVNSTIAFYTGQSLSTARVCP